MPLYTKESLEILRHRMDLFEVVSPHIHLKKSGNTYKGLCPFHEEKTPSFLIRRGDSHYHCFGCGAHGDAIAFCMNHLKMGFTETIESLAERFGVMLDHVKSEGIAGPSKVLLKEALQLSCRFYHFLLLYSKEGHRALEYLYRRGIDLDLIRRFEIGFAPIQGDALYAFVQAKKVSDEVLRVCGLIQTGETGQRRDFFCDRIVFPIRDRMGHVIGFSARKFQENSFGGKYINTPETPLFKKSEVLYGLSDSRKRIVKEKKAIIVEGQIDCLRLIHTGFDFTVAAQGTAFGEGHVRELLHLGVQTIFLALDGDLAGETAAIKIGDTFQKKGVEVRVVPIPSGQDPDTLLREQGPSAFDTLLTRATDYLTFLVERLSQRLPIDSPSGKNELTRQIVEKIRSWEHPVMIHESLCKVADLLRIPKDLIGVGMVPSIPVERKGLIQKETVDGDKILETDLLRILLLAGDTETTLFPLAQRNLTSNDLKVAPCRRLYEALVQAYMAGQRTDVLLCAAALEPTEEEIIPDIMSRKIQLEKAQELLLLTIQRILERNWMEEREAIKLQLHSGSLDEEQMLLLAKQFDLLTQRPPEVVVS